MKPSIHIVSRTSHAEKWQKLAGKDENSNIISSWFYDNTPETAAERQKICKKCIHDAQTADFTILYCEPGDILKFALVQVGAAIGANKMVVIVEVTGPCESITRVFKSHPNCVNTCDTMHKALMFINKH